MKQAAYMQVYDGLKSKIISGEFPNYLTFDMAQDVISAKGADAEDADFLYVRHDMYSINISLYDQP